MARTRKTREQLVRELKETRREREELQARLDRIVDITAGIIYILDPDGRFVFVNNAVEEILLYRPRELLGKHFSEIMPPDEYRRVSRMAVLPRFAGTKTGPEAAPKLFDERRTGERKTRNLEVQLLTKSQKEVMIMAGTVTGIVAVEGAYDRELAEKKRSKAAAFMGSQGLIFDITKYKRAENERFAIQHRLLEMHRMDALSRLAEGIAHDFNNKLGTILGCAEMIKQNSAAGREGLEAYIDPVITASQHAGDLAGKLLQFARHKTRHEENTDVNELVLNVVKLLEHAVDKRISIRHALHPKAPVVRGDVKQIQSAILNIAMNACEAMPQGGTLIFETSVFEADAAFRKTHPRVKAGTRYVRVSVTDTGIGMDREIKARMFEPFFTTKTDGSSMGIGCSSVTNCVKNHDGFVEVESEPGKGTRVDAFLPILSEPAAGNGSNNTACGSGRIKN